MKAFAANPNSHGILCFGNGIRLCAKSRVSHRLSLSVRNAVNGNASDGGGVYRTAGTITNCIAYNNTTRSGGAVANVAVGAAFYSCAPELTNGAGNITSDPGFIAAGSGSGLSAVLGDYHPLARTPCVDAGTNTTAALDYNGYARPLDGNGDGVGG